ncbi:hypothetical protein K503DRAFT_480483 [Rhizopogon vinicolor AM-OR11-026]|uniref:Uncharacterized protein n=1 Tax=Rhizopogon vinicolor AM-OR11-026 TaxID=1314800 RepID=A0A1B7MMY5_9AGAM|nr:hypothetical protein K503DRAFT_480483 [Rhizopogon vinicolor AM-OR11-026]
MISVGAEVCHGHPSAVCRSMGPRIHWTNNLSCSDRRMFGVSSGQVVLYFRSFPMDSRTLKLSILTIFILDCLHTVGFIGAIWRILVSCHRTSLDCQTSFSWGALAVLIGNVINIS